MLVQQKAGRDYGRLFLVLGLFYVSHFLHRSVFFSQVSDQIRDIPAETRGCCRGESRRFNSDGKSLDCPHNRQSLFVRETMQYNGPEIIVHMAIIANNQDGEKRCPIERPAFRLPFATAFLYL